MLLAGALPHEQRLLGYFFNHPERPQTSEIEIEEAGNLKNWLNITEDLQEEDIHLKIQDYIQEHLRGRVGFSN